MPNRSPSGRHFEVVVFPLINERRQASMHIWRTLLPPFAPAAYAQYYRRFGSATVHGGRERVCMVFDGHGVYVRITRGYRQIAIARIQSTFCSAYPPPNSRYGHALIRLLSVAPRFSHPPSVSQAATSPKSPSTGTSNNSVCFELTRPTDACQRNSPMPLLVVAEG
jgi:hypothetical protein